MRLIDERTLDGSRCFARLPYAGDWREIFTRTLKTPGGNSVALADVNIQGEVLRFRFRGHQFRVTRRDGELSFVVCDPLCFDLLLYQVACHFAELLDGYDADSHLHQ